MTSFLEKTNHLSRKHTPQCSTVAVKKATLYAHQIVPAFWRSAVIHAMPKHWAKNALELTLFQLQNWPSIYCFAASVKVIKLSGKHFSHRAFF